MKGLIVKPKWADLILNGEKTIELRGTSTKIRGKIGIIKSKTGQIFGEVEIIDSIELTEEMFNKLKDEHKVYCTRAEIPYKKLYGWILKNPTVYEKPKNYTHKQGCVIWVNI